MNKSAIGNKRLKIITVALFFLLTFLSLSLFPSPSLAGSWNGWIYQNPYPTANTLLAVKFITPKKGWAAGVFGTILYTEDGGDSWEAQESGTEQDIKSVTFVNEKQGWAVGNGGVIIHTEDAGKTWVVQSTHTEASLNKIFFINEKEGWVVGNEWGDTNINGMLLHTIDGGNKWVIQDIGIKRAIASIYFINPQTGWILAGDEVYRTTDGGNKWEKNKITVQIPMGGKIGEQGGLGSSEIPDDWMQGDIFFLNEKRGWAVVGMWFILHTEDGGKTWKKQLDTGFMSYGLGRLFFTDDKKGCAAGSSIFCTEDGGKTWKEILNVQPGERGHIEGFMVSVWGLAFADSFSGWAVGNEGQIMKTEDGGKNWKAKRQGSMIGNIYFYDAKMGWAILQGHKNRQGKTISNSIIRTDDGGDTWKVQKEFKTSMELKFSFINPTTGWAVGWQIDPRHDTYKILNYLILRTNDGGKTWITQLKEPGGQKDDYEDGLFDIFLINPNVGWVVGSRGRIFNTEDGGKHWERQKSGVKFRLRGVQFIDDKQGWVIGESMTEHDSIAIILHTNNGGKNWHIQWKKKSRWMWLKDLVFIDKNTGWVMGNIEENSGNAILAYTKDGGKTWLEKEFKEIFYDSMAFLDKERGIILTDKGQMLVTRDGGKTWNKQTKPIYKNPWHISDLFKKNGN